MRYKVNTQCPKCGLRYSYNNDDAPEAKRCPLANSHDMAIPDQPRKRCPDTWDQGNDYS